ncbi:hypothetical protein E2C01_060338 [Portunus trituberculatus]|uniref:Uncharacterized protein n=1 Tax=Portunus trituberculatus TaxID=210409 RepID=A0A5B7H7R7_PORTR|nr:hypothetical protein [Portunus trituberculatus]
MVVPLADRTRVMRRSPPYLYFPSQPHSSPSLPACKPAGSHCQPHTYRSRASLQGHWVLDPVIMNTNRRATQCRDSAYFEASLKPLTATLGGASIRTLNQMP